MPAATRTPSARPATHPAAPIADVPHSLSLADMLLSDVKSDVLHTFTDRAAVQSAVAAGEGGWGGSGGEAEAVRLAALCGGLCSTFTVTSYWATHFHALRALCLGADGGVAVGDSAFSPACCANNTSFLQSLAFSERWAASGGSSGAKFERSMDRRFVTKHVSKTEFDMFVGAIAPSYFVHMHGTLAHGAPSTLVRILGAYKVVAVAEEVVASGGGGGGEGIGSARAADVGSGAAAPSGASGAAAAVGGGVSGAATPSSVAEASEVGVGGAGFGSEAAASTDALESAGRGVSGGGLRVRCKQVSKTTSYLLVMEDLFYQRSVLPGMTFDLKGKLRAQKRVAGNGGGGGGGGGGEAGGVGGGTASAAFAAAAAARAFELPSQPLGEVYNPFGRSPVEAAAGTSGSAAAEGAAHAQEGAFETPLLAPAEAPLVLLDGDLLAFTRGFPLSLTDEAKRHLDAALRRDVAWLAGQSVVDYSLLIGVEPSSGLLSVGMIDYVRRFDMVKRLENRVKSVTSMAEPTVVQPDRYAERLLTAANRYLAGVPHHFSHHR